MKLNIVLIDFENVQPMQLEKLRGLPVEVRVFLGANQSKLPLELVASLQPFGEAAKYIQLSGHGKNALDFHLAFYLGKLAQEHPKAFFHVISKDTGFDPLVCLLKTLGIFCQRSESIDDMAFLKTQERLTAAKILLSSGSARPATLAKLRNALHTHFGKTASEPELDAVVQGLKAAKLVSEGEGGKLTYPAS